MSIFRAIVVLLVVVVIFVLALQNSETRVPLVLLNRVYHDTRLVFLLLYAFLFGAFVIFVLALANEIGLRRTLSRQRKERALLLEELNALRNLPLGTEEEVPVKKAK